MYLDLNHNQITSKDKHLTRTEILTNFATSNNIELLFSVRILDECIDIPSCDSIYITYPSTSKIRTIQRISRAICIDKKNPNKEANIYIWCDQYDRILETLSSIKEFDIHFATKIKIYENGFYTTKKLTTSKEVEFDKKQIEKYIISVKEYKSPIKTNKVPHKQVSIPVAAIVKKTIKDAKKDLIWGIRN